MFPYKIIYLEEYVIENELEENEFEEKWSQTRTSLNDKVNKISPIHTFIHI